jgi:hypothetical protein
VQTGKASAGLGDALHEAEGDRIASHGEHDWHALRRSLGRKRRRSAEHDEHIGVLSFQLLCQSADCREVTPHVTDREHNRRFVEARRLQSVAKTEKTGTMGASDHHDAHALDAVCRLCLRYERSSSSTQRDCDELPPPHKHLPRKRT